MSLNLKKYQQYILTIIACLIFILIGAVVLAISFFQANRHQAASLKQLTLPTQNLN